VKTIRSPKIHQYIMAPQKHTKNTTKYFLLLAIHLSFDFKRQTELFLVLKACLCEQCL